jgi:hypothetical protein
MNSSYVVMQSNVATSPLYGRSVMLLSPNGEGTHLLSFKGKVEGVLARVPAGGFSNAIVVHLVEGVMYVFARSLEQARERHFTF